MAINNTVTYKGTDPASDHVFTIRGNANTRAEALAEANARLALTVMNFPQGRESTILPGADAGAAAGGVGKDATMVLSKGPGYSDKVVHIQECTVAIKKASTKGKIDPANQLVIDFVTAYRDGDGLGGYAFSSGQFDE
jgi:hypothetical protein